MGIWPLALAAGQFAQIASALDFVSQCWICWRVTKGFVPELRSRISWLVVAKWNPWSGPTGQHGPSLLVARRYRQWAAIIFAEWWPWWPVEGFSWLCQCFFKVTSTAGPAGHHNCVPCSLSNNVYICVQCLYPCPNSCWSFHSLVWHQLISNIGKQFHYIWKAVQ